MARPLGSGPALAARAAGEREVTQVVAVAASGGRDSTALLHATARAAQGTALQVVALHVHHGLNPAAGEWQRHVRQKCARWSRAGLPVQFLTLQLNGTPVAGESIEAWARRGRYAALAEMAREAGAKIILLAHHRRDQGETLLLQALRGGGPAGLAAMPREAEREGLLWCRPWLDQPGEAIAAYVSRHRLSHIDDDSNLDTRFDRNRLRHDVWPVLLAAFPHAEATLAQAGRHARWAAELMDEVGEGDLAGLRAEGGAVAVAAWCRLSPARRLAALRCWLRAQSEEGVRDSLLARLMEELPRAAQARWPWDATRELRLYRGLLSVATVHAEPAVPSATRPLALDRPGCIELAEWAGRLELTAVEQGGVAPAVLAACELRRRLPGDTFQFAPRGTARGLKKQYQARAVPAWQRNGPFIALPEHPVFVPGLGIDARAMAGPGEPQLAIRWWPTNAGLSASVG